MHLYIPTYTRARNKNKNMYTRIHTRVYNARAHIHRTHRINCSQLANPDTVSRGSERLKYVQNVSAWSSRDICRILRAFCFMQRTTFLSPRIADVRRCGVRRDASRSERVTSRFPAITPANYLSRLYARTRERKRERERERGIEKPSSFLLLRPRETLTWRYYTLATLI